MAALVSPEWAVAIAVIGLLLNVGGMVVVLGNSRSKVIASLNSAMSERTAQLHSRVNLHEKADWDEFSKVRNEMGMSEDRLREQMGELGHSLRQALTDNREWVRDHCALQKNSETQHQSIVANLAAMDQKQEARSGVLEARLIAIDRAQALSEQRLTRIERNGSSAGG